MPKLTPNLWFDKDAEEAANFYAAIFPDSRVDNVSRAPADFPGGHKGDVLTVNWTMSGQPFTGINGGPEFKFSEAISFQVSCETQDEVDMFWSKLSEGGEEGPCGWLKDRFGLSWQIVPTALPRLLGDPDQEKAQRVMAAMLKMRKIDIAELERAAAEA